jgi:DNA-binding CsgD family transcriptional regulator
VLDWDALTLREAGDPSLEWLLRESVAGEVFAAGHAEVGNNLPVLLSTARAEPVEGGYRFWSHKMFGGRALGPRDGDVAYRPGAWTPPDAGAGGRPGCPSQRVHEPGRLERTDARQEEVVQLIAGGLSNRQIVEALVITEGTARINVERILAALGLGSRAQVAVWAAKQPGLLH